jgi:hypothetical protein
MYVIIRDLILGKIPTSRNVLIMFHYYLICNL